jgi:hypothetical protein
VARSRIYTVHVRMWSASSDREAVFVREGFSWGAFFFSVLWALWYRMWFAALIVFALSVALSLLTEILEIDQVVSAVAGAVFALIVAWEANDWRRRALERRGYLNVGVVAAPDLVEAERRFFAKPIPGRNLT